MKFAKYLAQHTLPEWQDFYVRYKTVKKLLKEGETSDLSTTTLLDITRRFLNLLFTDLQRVNDFVGNQRKYLDEENSSLQALSTDDEELGPRLRILGQHRHRLREFAEINLTAFYKAAKKHDKVVKGPIVCLSRVMRNVECQPFVSLAGVVLLSSTQVNGLAATNSESSEDDRESEEETLWGDILGDPLIDKQWFSLSKISPQKGLSSLPPTFDHPFSQYDGSSGDIVNANIGLELEDYTIVQTGAMKGGFSQSYWEGEHGTEMQPPDAPPISIKKINSQNQLREDCFSLFCSSTAYLVRSAEASLKLIAPELWGGSADIKGERESHLESLHKAVSASVEEFKLFCADPSITADDLNAMSLSLRLKIFPLSLSLLSRALSLTSPDSTASLNILLKGYKALTWEGGHFISSSQSTIRDQSSVVNGSFVDNSLLYNASESDVEDSSAKDGTGVGLSLRAPSTPSRRSASDVRTSGLLQSRSLNSEPDGHKASMTLQQNSTFSTSSAVMSPFKTPLVATPFRGMLTDEWGSDVHVDGTLGLRLESTPFLSRTWLRYRPQVFEWIFEYSVRKQLRRDALAGVTIGILLIPQGLVCATLAGAAPIYGLYSGLPAIVYVLFGASKQAAIGPMSVPALVIFSALSDAYRDDLAPPPPALYAARLSTLTFQVGLILFCMGWLQLGFMIRFISRPVLQGFTSAAAILTILSVSSDALGTNVSRSSLFYEMVFNVAKALPNTQAWTVCLTIGSLLGLFYLQYRGVTSATFFILILTITCFSISGAAGAISPVALVGPQPSSLPSILLPLLSGDDFKRLFPAAFPVALISFLESIAVSKAYAQEVGYEISVQTELKALGFANLLGSFLHTLPVMGALGRSSVNASMGATSQISGFFSALTVLLVLLVAMPAISYLPRAVLAACIVSGVFSLIKVSEFKRLWKSDRRDFFVMGGACLATLFVGVTWGVITSMGLSLAVFLALTTQPRVEEVGRLSGTVIYKNVGMEGVGKVPGVKILRFLAPMYFANASVLRERIAREILNRKPLPPRMQWRALVLCLSAVASIDSSSLAELEECAAACRSAGCCLVLASANAYVEEALRASGTLMKIAGEPLLTSSADSYIYRRVHDAVRAILSGKVKISRHKKRTNSVQRESGAPFLFPAQSPSLCRRLAGLIQFDRVRH